jgi:hypothetical protein
MSGETSRRALLGALAVAPAIVALGLPTAAASAAPMESLWRAYLATQRAIYETPGSSDKETSAQADRLTDLEDAIMKAKATTPREAAMKLWASLPHSDGARWVEESIAYERFDVIFARERDLDFPARLTVGAIAALGWRA